MGVGFFRCFGGGLSPICRHQGSCSMSGAHAQVSNKCIMGNHVVCLLVVLVLFNLDFNIRFFLQNIGPTSVHWELSVMLGTLSSPRWGKLSYGDQLSTQISIHHSVAPVCCRVQRCLRPMPSTSLMSAPASSTPAYWRCTFGASEYQCYPALFHIYKNPLEEDPV